MIKISGYKIIKKIGSGGMGDVYLAEHEKLEKKVAIKSLHKNLASDPSFRKRFSQEAKTHSKLDHPNIVKLLDYKERKDGLFLIMEYVDGKQLDEYIKKISGPIPENELTKLFSQILETIGYAHDEGIIHRDIKPSNIMIDVKGRIKVLDFGIAKMQEEDNGLTKTGIQIGTATYMSPEQVDTKTLDYLTDIYSLGVTLFYMAVGKSPYDGETNSFRIQTKIISDPLPQASNIYPGVSKKIEKIISKATQKEKENRYQNCNEFKSDFNKEVITENKNKSESIFYKLGKNANKIKKKILFALTIPLIIVLGLFIVNNYPSVIYNYNKLKIKVNTNEIFDLSDDNFGILKLKINKPYNKAELLILIDGKPMKQFFDFGNQEIEKNILKDLSKKTKEAIIKKMILGEDIKMKIIFSVIGGINKNKVLSEYTESYLLNTNKDQFTDIPNILNVTSVNFKNNYKYRNKKDLFSQIIDGKIITSNKISPPKIIQNNSIVKVSITVDKLYEKSVIVNHLNRSEKNPELVSFELEKDRILELESKTKIKKNTNNTYTISREWKVDEDYTDYSHIALHNYDSEGIYHKIYIGSYIVDNKKPKVSSWLSWNCDTDDDISGCVYVSSEKWRGSRKPFKVRVKGDISKIYINGYKISFDKERAKNEMLDLYKVLNFYTELGHYRWPIKVYDLRGNIGESYIEGECVPVD